VVCLSMLWRSWRRAPAQRQQVIFGTGALLVIALHSVVDYPPPHQIDRWQEIRFFRPAPEKASSRHIAFFSYDHF